MTSPDGLSAKALAADALSTRAEDTQLLEDVLDELSEEDGPSSCREDVKPRCPMFDPHANEDDRRAESHVHRPLSLHGRNVADAGSIVREFDGPLDLRRALAVGAPSWEDPPCSRSDSRVDIRLIAGRSESGVFDPPALPLGNPFHDTLELEELFKILGTENNTNPLLEWTRGGPNLSLSGTLSGVGSDSECYLECDGDDPFQRTLANLNGVASLRCGEEEDLFGLPFASVLESPVVVSRHDPRDTRLAVFSTRPDAPAGLEDPSRSPGTTADRRLLLDEELDRRLRRYLDVRWRRRLQAEACGRRDRLQLLRATDSESWCLDRSSHTASRTKSAERCRERFAAPAVCSSMDFAGGSRCLLQPGRRYSDERLMPEDLAPSGSETAIRRTPGRCAFRTEASGPAVEESDRRREEDADDGAEPEVDDQIRPEPPTFSRDEVEDESFVNDDDDSGSSEYSLTDGESDAATESDGVATEGGVDSPRPPAGPLALDGPVLVRCIDEQTQRRQEMLLCPDAAYRRAASRLPADAPRARLLELLLRRSEVHEGELFHVLLDAGRPTPSPPPRQDREVRLADVYSALVDMVESVEAASIRPMPKTKGGRSLASLKRVNVDEILSSVFVDSFRSYSKLGGRLKSGAVMTRTNSNCWLKKAGLVDDRFPLRAAADHFATFARSKLVLNMADYAQFLIRVARRKRMIVMDLVQQLVTARAPTDDPPPPRRRTTTTTTTLKHKPNTSKRSIATNARSDPWLPRSRRRARSLMNIKLGQTAPPACL